MSEFLQILLNYKENGSDITATYKVSEEIWAHARSWQAHTAHPTAKDLGGWLKNNGGKLHRADGPAVIEREADGSTCESYYTEGKRHRVDGPAVVVCRADGSGYEAYFLEDKCHRTDGPAVIEREADGSTCQSYWLDDKRHSADGPAVVTCYADGSLRQEYYTDGTLTKEDYLPSLSCMPGVTILRNPPIPTP